jgi:hypothetical protein
MRVHGRGLRPGDVPWKACPGPPEPVKRVGDAWLRRPGCSFSVVRPAKPSRSRRGEIPEKKSAGGPASCLSTPGTRCGPCGGSQAGNARRSEAGVARGARPGIPTRWRSRNRGEWMADQRERRLRLFSRVRTPGRRAGGPAAWRRALSTPGTRCGPCGGSVSRCGSGRPRFKPAAEARRPATRGEARRESHEVRGGGFLPGGGAGTGGVDGRSARKTAAPILPSSHTRETEPVARRLAAAVHGRGGGGLRWLGFAPDRTARDDKGCVPRQVSSGHLAYAGEATPKRLHEPASARTETGTLQPTLSTVP